MGKTANFTSDHLTNGESYWIAVDEADINSFKAMLDANAHQLVVKLLYLKQVHSPRKELKSIIDNIIDMEEKSLVIIFDYEREIHRTKFLRHVKMLVEKHKKKISMYFVVNKIPSEIYSEFDYPILYFEPEITMEQNMKMVDLESTSTAEKEEAQDKFILEPDVQPSDPLLDKFMVNSSEIADTRALIVCTDELLNQKYTACEEFRRTLVPAMQDRNFQVDSHLQIPIEILQQDQTEIVTYLSNYYDIIVLAINRNFSEIEIFGVNAFIENLMKVQESGKILLTWIPISLVINSPLKNNLFKIQHLGEGRPHDDMITFSKIENHNKRTNQWILVGNKFIDMIDNRMNQNE